MRLSQTRPSSPHSFSHIRRTSGAPRADAPWAVEAPVRRAQSLLRHPLVWRVGLGASALLLLAAAVVAAIGPGRFLISHADPRNTSHTQGKRSDHHDPGTRAERHHPPAGQAAVDCTLILPANPLSAQGLSTPFQLIATSPKNGACHEGDPNEMAFAQAAVLDPATGAISIYNPLVIDRGTTPAAQPVVPTLPVNAVVGLWFGFNGDVLRLQGTQGGDLIGAKCVNGLGGSVFGQVSYCNAPAFFAAASAAIQAHKLAPPALGTARDGQTCPTVRDFSVVDQDQSDNVTSAYLVMPDGTIAQYNDANLAALPNALIERNGSDEGLLVKLDGALGCAPWMAPDLANPGQMTTALPLNELQAAAFQPVPVALTPIRDPMVLVNGNDNLIKVNLYRAGVDQPVVTSQQQAIQDNLTYCEELFKVAPARLMLDEPLTSPVSSADPAKASNLFTFLAARFNGTVGPDGLNCTGLLHRDSPVTLKSDQNGVVISATIHADTPAPAVGTPNTPATPTATSTTTTGTGNAGGTITGPTPTPVPTNTTTPSPPATSTAPDCVVNGATIQGCMGTTTINGQSCAFAFDAATRQVTVTCPQG